MQHQPRLRVLAYLDAEIVRAEAEVVRWTRVVESMSAAGEPTRAARLFLRVVRSDLERLDRRRDALLEGGEDRAAVTGAS